MIEKYEKMFDYGVDHTRFGGLIYLSDFDTNYCKRESNKSSVIASRILSDEMFDKTCRKNIVVRERKALNK